MHRTLLNLKNNLSKLKKRTQGCAFLCEDGFTLIEILTALFLVTMVLLAIPMAMNDSQRDSLENAIDDIERAVRFSSNEAVLKNAIVRLRFDLDKTPVEYFVESAPNGSFVLNKEADSSKMSIKEIEAATKEIKKQNAQFNKVAEFKDISRNIEESVFILGMASSDSDKIKSSGDINIYFYPTGEKDASLVLFATEEEVASLDIKAFRDGTKVNYKPLAKNITKEELYDAQISIAKDMVDEWIKQ